MIRSHRHRFIFVSTPKAGTHTMYHVLTQQFEGEQLPGPYHRRDLPQGIEAYMIFTTVRHPLERFVSAFHSLTRVEPYKHLYRKALGALTLPKFVDWLVSHDWEGAPPTIRGHETLMPMSAWLKPVPLDVFLKLECLEDDFAKLPFCAHRLQLPKLLSRRHPPAAKVISQAMRDRLQQFYADDFARFGYVS